MIAQRRKDAKKAKKNVFKNAFLCVFASLREMFLIWVLLASAPAFAAEPAAEHLSHGRFDDVVVYRPAGTPTSFAMFFSGAGGLDANAVKLARKPVDDRLMREYPHVLVHTSGFDVGLPEGTMGNSEVGHQNIGAGRIVDQESVRITKAIRNGEFFGNVDLTYVDPKRFDEVKKLAEQSDAETTKAEAKKKNNAF